MAAVAIVGAVLAIAGGVVGGIAQKKSADAQASAVKAEGKQQLRESYAEAAAIRRRGKLLQSQARTGIAKAGVLAEGSPLELLAQNAAEIEVDALLSQTYGINAERQANAQAKALKSQGKWALYSSILGGAAAGASAYAGAGGSFGGGTRPRGASSVLNTSGGSYQLPALGRTPSSTYAIG